MDCGGQVGQVDHLVPLGQRVFKLLDAESASQQGRAPRKTPHRRRTHLPKELEVLNLYL